jgi:glycosyltransferase involved in cell wall biosynthesis
MAYLNGAPILILAFNRPEYLGKVLASLKNQKGAKVEDSQVHLLLDGAVNEFSGVKYAEDREIDLSEKEFVKYFPQGKIHRSKTNIGVAKNFARAEEIAFLHTKSDMALFFEDDLELGPAYLSVMQKLATIASQNPMIGYFAAYGTPSQSENDQRRYASDVQALDHHWAFGLTRRQWERSKPLVDQYLRLVENVDYRKRDDQAIAALLRSWGLATPGASQDAIKAAACYITGGVKINTLSSYGRYIGEKGLNFSPRLFAEMGFNNAVALEDDLFNRSSVSDAEIRFFRRKLHGYAFEVNISEQSVDGRQASEAANLEAQLFSATDIIQSFYEVFFGRKPDEAGLKNWASRLAGKRDLSATIQALSKSTEFIARKSPQPSTQPNTASSPSETGQF